MINQIQLNQISMIDNINPLEENTNTNIIKYSDIVKSNLPSSTSTTTPPKYTTTPPNSEELSVIIKNITKSSFNIDYINDIFNELNIYRSTVTDVNFKNGITVISFSSLYSKNLFLNLKFKDTSYSELFKMQSLPTETRKLGLLYYHAIKSCSITSHKSVFNNRTMSYELRTIVNDNIDWKSANYSPTSVELSSWMESFAKFTKTMSKAESSKT